MVRKERHGVHPWDVVEDFENDAGESGFSYPAKGEGRERDAELVGREKLVHVPLETKRGASAGLAESCELLDARLAQGDERELRRDEKSRRQNKDRDGESPEECPLQHG